MQLHHRGFEASLDNFGKHGKAPRNGVVYQRLVFAACALQYIIRNLDRVFRMPRMTDTDAHAPEIVRAQARSNVLEAVMAGDTAAEFYFYRSRRQVELVVYHQDFFRPQFVEIRERAYSLAGTVHKGLRFQ